MELLRKLLISVGYRVRVFILFSHHEAVDPNKVVSAKFDRFVYWMFEATS